MQLQRLAISTKLFKGAANERTVQHWFKKYRSGDLSLENELRGNIEASADNAILKSMVKENLRQTVR